MKKNLLFLFLLLCSLSTFVSCKDDDEIYYITETDLNGVYLGTMDVSAPFGGAELGAKDIKQKIYITKTGENLVKFQLKNFVFNNIPIGDLEINNIAVERSGDNFMINGTGNLTLIVGGCDVTLNGTVSTSGNCNILINVDVVSAGTAGDFTDLKVKVDFTGKKMTADQSSEALIKSFTIDSDSIKNIEIKDNSIVFYVIDGITDLNFVPTIEISEGATITPASGVKQDFSKEVKYTVVSEDGITTHVYTIKQEGNIRIIDFEEWVTIKTSTSGSTEEFQLPEGTWGSTNDGVMSANDMLGDALEQMGLSRIEYPVLPSTDAFSGNKSAMIKTIDMLLLIPQPDGSVLDFNAALGGIIPYNTAGSLFLGTFKTDMSDMLASTKFGVPYTGKPVTFSGNYKYTPGEFYRIGRDTVDQKDEFAIYALLYEAIDEEGNEVTLIGGSSDAEKNQKYKIDDSPYVVLRANVPYEGAKTDWTSFEIPFTEVNGKTYDPNKQYKLTIVCTSSKDGANYNGAPGSVLQVDALQIVGEQ